MPKNAIELIRVSTEGQAAADRASIPGQRAVNRRTAQAFDLTIVRSIEISDVSGAAVLYAPEIQQLIKLIAAPDIHGVIAREFSRLMRPENFSDYALLQAFADSNTVLYLPEGPIDFSSKTGRLMGTIRAAIAGMERTEILERIWSSKEEKRKAGKLAQSRKCLPFGVGYEEARGFFYTEESEKVREAFRLLLSGNSSYHSIGRIVGIAAFNLRNLLRNPIYTGWRVIDKRRDMSPAGKVLKKDGRQGDRIKILRAPEDVIRIKVIEQSLISEAEFQQAQQVMKVKRTRHWKTQPQYLHRFTYNGFLTCAECEQIIYTGLMRDDYYICKGRRLANRCQTHYMRRDILDSALDELFADRFTDVSFLSDIAARYEEVSASSDTTQRVDRLESQIISLQAKRSRVLDSFFDGVITKTERDAKLSALDRDLTQAQESLMRERLPVELNTDLLIEAFKVFTDWQYLKRDDKRRILSTVIPDIHVADYRVKGLFFNATSSSKRNHTDRDSSRRQA